jgi:uncharacterized protein involved in type VI secretion and phage assembly
MGMSFKSIDLQFALHKNDEAGFKQNQLSHKPKQDQAILENQAALSTDKQRQRSSKVDETSRTNVHTENEKKQKQQREQTGTKRATSEKSTKSSSPVDHPYKGHHIDYSL